MTARLRRLGVPVAVLAGAPVVGLVIVALFGHGDVFGSLPVILGYGLVFGSLNALAAVGVILVYRSARVVNFAHAAFGGVAVMLYVILRAGKGWNFWLAIAAALAAAAVLGALVQVFVVRRLATSSRLVLTVATIGIAQMLGAVTLLLPLLFGYSFSGDQTANTHAPPTGISPTPFFRFQWNWNPVVFNGNHATSLVVAVVAMLAMAWFLRFSRLGVAVRGSSENGPRAEQLGINVNNVSTVVWIMAALLSASAALVAALIDRTTISAAAGGGAGIAGAIGTGMLLRALAASVVARMEDLPLAVAAALGISILEQAVLWARGDVTFIDVGLLVVIIAVLLMQRVRTGRADAEASTWEATEEIRGIPAELAPLPEVRAGVRRALWLGAIVVVAWPWVMSPGQTNLGGVYAIYGIVGISLVILTGWGGQISLGQFGFVAVGAAVGGWTTATAGLPFPVALVTGSVAASAVAVCVGLPALRIKGLFLAVTTLAFAVAVSSWLLRMAWVPKHVGRPVVLFFDANSDERTMYYLCIAGLAAAVYVSQGLRRSRTGRWLIAMRDNERTAQSYGMNLFRARLTAFAISGALAGFAGVLYANHQNGVVRGAFAPEMSVQLFLMAVIGGLGSVYAVLVGAIYLGTVNILFTDPGIQLLSGSIGVLAILLFFPKGLGALVFRLRDAWLRRIAYRRRIYSAALVGDRLKEGEEARVAISPRLEELGDVDRIYELDSEIGESGASQLTKLWRY